MFKTLPRVPPTSPWRTRSKTNALKLTNDLINKQLTDLGEVSAIKPIHSPPVKTNLGNNSNKNDIPTATSGNETTVTLKNLEPNKSNNTRTNFEEKLDSVIEENSEIFENLQKLIINSTPNKLNFTFQHFDSEEDSEFSFAFKNEFTKESASVPP